MEIVGKIIKILPIQTGVGQSGRNWAKQSFVLETTEQYPKTICFSIFGAERIEQCIPLINASLAGGTDIGVSIEISSREYNDKWYTDINAYRVSEAVRSNNVPLPTPSQDATSSFSQQAPAAPSPSEDLPF